MHAVLKESQAVQDDCGEVAKDKAAKVGTMSHHEWPLS